MGMAVVSAVGMAFLTSLQQERLRDRVGRLEETVARQRVGLRSMNKGRDEVERLGQSLGGWKEELQSVKEGRRADRRWFMLLLRAQETAWTGHEGVPVEARLTVEADVVNKGSPVRLLAEVRNVSDREQTVSRPFFYDFSIRVSHDGKPIKYLGPFKSMAPPPPVVLPPGRIVRASLALSPDFYAELSQAGAFSAEWVYSSRGLGTARTAVTWSGSLPAVKVSWRAR
jgi:hypothetical protein